MIRDEALDIASPFFPSDPLADWPRPLFSAGFLASSCAYIRPVCLPLCNLFASYVHDHLLRPVFETCSPDFEKPFAKPLLALQLLSNAQAVLLGTNLRLAKAALDLLYRPGACTSPGIIFLLGPTLLHPKDALTTSDWSRAGTSLARWVSRESEGMESLLCAEGKQT
jgi:hypothetical protein